MFHRSTVTTLKRCSLLWITAFLSVSLLLIFTTSLFDTSTSLITVPSTSIFPSSTGVFSDDQLVPDDDQQVPDDDDKLQTSYPERTEEEEDAWRTDGDDTPERLQDRSDILLERIKNQCSLDGIKTTWKYPDKPWINSKQPRLLVYNEKFHILYTTNPKTGSTSFKKFLYLADGNLPKEETTQEIIDGIVNVHNTTGGHFTIIETKPQLPPEPVFSASFKFVVIRNPVTRLVSGKNQEILLPDWLINNHVT